MKKITPILAGLLLSASAQAYDKSESFYVGVRVGGSYISLSKTAKILQTSQGANFSKNVMSASGHIGRRFDEFGVEINGGPLNQLTNNIGNGVMIFKASDYLFSFDLNYYIPMSNIVELKVGLGLGALYSRNSITFNSATQGATLTASMLAAGGVDRNDMLMGYTMNQIALLPAGKSSITTLKAAPKVNVGLVIATSERITLTAELNLIYPMKNDHLMYAVRGSFGVNYHF